MDLRERRRLERIDFLMSTGNYVCLLRKRSVSVTWSTLKTPPAQRICL